MNPNRKFNWTIVAFEVGGIVFDGYCGDPDNEGQGLSVIKTSILFYTRKAARKVAYKWNRENNMSDYKFKPAKYNPRQDT